MTTARGRLKARGACDRVNDPFMRSVAAWNETCERWARESMPVKNLDDIKGINVHLLGYQDQAEAIPPVGAKTESASPATMRRQVGSWRCSRVEGR